MGTVAGPLAGKAQRVVSKLWQLAADASKNEQGTHPGVAPFPPLGRLPLVFACEQVRLGVVHVGTGHDKIGGDDLPVGELDALGEVIIVNHDAADW